MLSLCFWFLLLWIGVLLDLAATSKSLSVCCWLGSALWAGGGLISKWCWHLSEAACAKQNTSFDVLGGEGEVSKPALLSKDTAVEQGRAEQKVRARSAICLC